MICFLLLGSCAFSAPSAADGVSLVESATYGYNQLNFDAVVCNFATRFEHAAYRLPRHRQSQFPYQRNAHATRKFS
jgi:hypothetical protein